VFYTPLCLINDLLCLLIWLPLIINTVALFIKEEIQGSRCKRALVSISPMFECLIMSLWFTWRYHSVFNMDHGWYTIWLLNFVTLEFPYKFRIVLEKISFLSSISSVAQSCPTKHTMDCSTPGLPDHHWLQELAQAHIRRIGDAIQPPHPLLSPSLPAFNLFQHQSLSHEFVLHIRWPK